MGWMRPPCWPCSGWSAAFPYASAVRWQFTISSWSLYRLPDGMQQTALYQIGERMVGAPDFVPVSDRRLEAAALHPTHQGERGFIGHTDALRALVDKAHNKGQRLQLNAAVGMLHAAGR